MNKKQMKVLGEMIELQENAVELLGTKQARVMNFEELVAKELTERIQWRIGEFLEEGR